MNRIAVAKHDGKIRLHLELPVGGDDPSLVRVHDIDIPLVHALALASGILNEANGLLRALQPKPTFNQEQRAKLERMAEERKAERAAERDALRLMLDERVGEKDRAELRRLLAEGDERRARADAAQTVADIGRASSGQMLPDGQESRDGTAEKEKAPELGELRGHGTHEVEQSSHDGGDEGNGHVHSDTSSEKKVAD